MSGRETDLNTTVVVMPALNEAECIGPAVERWQCFNPLEIRVVDNASTDATAIRAREAGAHVLHEAARGYGAAAWRGIQDLPGACEWVLFSSADGSDRLGPEDFEHWRAAARAGADLLIGDRVSRIESRRHLKSVQSFGNRLCCLLIRAGWGGRFRDLGSLRWIRKRVLQKLDLRDRGFGWNVEMQVRALEFGCHIVEIPVDYFPRDAGRSKISGSLSGTLRAGFGILQTFWKLKSHPRATKPNGSKGG